MQSRVQHWIRGGLPPEREGDKIDIFSPAFGASSPLWTQFWRRRRCCLCCCSCVHPGVTSLHMTYFCFVVALREGGGVMAWLRRRRPQASKSAATFLLLPLHKTRSLSLSLTALCAVGKGTAPIRRIATLQEEMRKYAELKGTEFCR